MKTILLVDDENINHILAKRILSDTYRLLTVWSGKEALSLLEKEKPDLVLMDIIMPELDGFETFRMMLEKEALADIPVVFLTSKEEEDVKEKCLAEGAKAYVTKPFSPKDLKQTIGDLLDA